jgi:hypothetical protein
LLFHCSAFLHKIPSSPSFRPLPSHSEKSSFLNRRNPMAATIIECRCINREQPSNATNRVGDGRISDNTSGFAIFQALKNIPHHHEHSEWITRPSFTVSHLSSKFRPRRPNPALPEQRLKQHGVFTASRHLVPWSICIDLNVLYQTDASSPGKLTSHYSQTAWQLGLQSEFGPRITFAGPASNCQLQMVFGWLNGGCARRINTPVSGSVQTAPSEVSSTASSAARRNQQQIFCPDELPPTLRRTRSKVWRI